MLATPLHQAGAAEYGVDSRAQCLRAIDDEQAFPLRIDAALHQALQQVLGCGSVLRGPFLDTEHMFVALGIDTNGPDHSLVAEVHSIHINDQHVHVIKTPLE